MKTNRIQFSLEKYESGKYKVVTKNGRKARIIYTAFKSKQPIIAIVEEENDKESFSEFSLDGKLWIGGRVSDSDLYLEETVFEDGDIVTNEKDIAIYKEIDKCYCGISEQGCLAIDAFFYYKVITRLATDEEKQRLFDAFKKDGKCWNAEKKCIEDIKKEYKFKPFDRVLVRDDIEDLWEINFFSHKANKDEYGYRCLDCYYIYCIPYEGNEELLGTTNSLKQ